MGSRRTRSAAKTAGHAEPPVLVLTRADEADAAIHFADHVCANPSIAGQQAQLYAQRQSVSNAAGQALASQFESQALAAANKTVEFLTKSYNTAAERAKKADAGYKRLEQKHDDLRNDVKNHLAKDTGDKVDSEVNTASKKGKL